MQQKLFNFLEVPQLYTKLYPAPATSNRGSGRTKSNDNNTISQNGGGSGGGSGGSSRRDDDLRNSCSQSGDSELTKSESLDKNKCIFICDKLPYLKSATNLDGASNPPKVTLGHKEMQICVKGSSKDRVCTNDNCKFAHLFVLDKITKGEIKLNT